MFSIMRRTDWPGRRRMSDGSERRSSVARTRTSPPSEPPPARPAPPQAAASSPVMATRTNVAAASGNALLTLTSSPFSRLASLHHVGAAVVGHVADGEPLGPHRLDEVDLHAGKLHGRLSVGYEGNLAHLERRVLLGRVAVKRQAEVGLTAVAPVVDEHPQPRVADLTAVDGHLELFLRRVSQTQHRLLHPCAVALRRAATRRAAARAAGAKRPRLLQPSVHLLPASRTGILLAHHQPGIDVFPLPLPGLLEVHGQVMVLGREPEGTDALERTEYLVRSSALGRHQLGQGQRGHAVVAVREGCHVPAAGPVGVTRDLLHHLLLRGRQVDQVQRRQVFGTRLCAYGPSAGAGVAAGLLPPLLGHGTLREERVLVGETEGPQHVEQEVGVVRIEADGVIGAFAEYLQLLRGEGRTRGLRRGAELVEVKDSLCDQPPWDVPPANVERYSVRREKRRGELVARRRWVRRVVVRDGLTEPAAEKPEGGCGQGIRQHARRTSQDGGQPWPTARRPRLRVELSRELRRH